MANAKNDKPADAPDIRIENQEPYLVPGVTVDWVDNNDGTITVSFSGEHAVVVTEQAGADGPVWTSPAFRGKKPGEVKDVIRTALVNSINTAFLDEWRKRYPPATKGRAAIERENADMANQIALMRKVLAEQGIVLPETA